MGVIQNMLVDKLKPKTFEQVVLLERIRKQFPNGELTQNVIFAGTQGSGKTSLARVLSNQFPTKMINISSNRGIDVVRNDIEQFASTKSLEINKSNKIKVIILDEMDGGNEFMFRALRNTIEKFSKTTRFIGTCNYLNKIPDAIQSRMQVYLFDPQNESETDELTSKFRKRILSVTKKLGLEWESDEVLEDFISSRFPDLRGMWQFIQGVNNSGETIITSETVYRKQFQYLELYEAMLSKKTSSVELYQMVIGSFSGKSSEIFRDLSAEFPQWIFENHQKLENYVPLIMSSIADWDYKRNFHIDENLGLLACVYECNRILTDKNG